MSDGLKQCGTKGAWHARHWFSVYGHVGLRSPICVRCGAPNPNPITTDDWASLLDVAPHLVGDDLAQARLRQRLNDEKWEGDRG